MFSNVTDTKLFTKISFDGYDFIQGELGRLITPTRFDNFITKYTYAKYTDTKDFIGYCCENYKKEKINYIPEDLMYKYNVGIYTLKNCEDKNNPWAGRDYVLFNPKRLNSIYGFCNVTPETKFWVCPGTNGIGFRIINTEEVENAFKWLFMSGNNIIYGNPNKEETCYIVEGFRDYVALRESGYNVIGLGSVDISKTQEEYIKTLKDPILLLDNDSYGLKKSLQYKDKYRIATLKSKYKDAYETFLHQDIKIIEIK